jgi:hypothetical protein
MVKIFIFALQAMLAAFVSRIAGQMTINVSRQLAAAFGLV